MSKTNLRPLGTKIVVDLIESEGKTSGGIIIPDNAKEKPQYGIVLAVGPGTVLANGQRVAPDVQVGDKVFFTRNAGAKIEDYFLILEKDIIAVVTE